MGILRTLLLPRERRAVSPYVQAFLRGDDFPNSWGPNGTVAQEGELALYVSTVYACVRVLAETMASLPLHLYRQLADGSKEEARDHPYYRLIHSAPNPEMSSFAFREALTGHLYLWGNAYAELARNYAGQVIAIWPLRPDRMSLERDASGQLVYSYRMQSGEPKEFPRTDVLHFRLLSPNGMVGYSPISLQQQSISLAMEAQRYGDKFFQNDARPGGVLQVAGRLSPEAADRLRKTWQEAHAGSSNAWKTAVLEDGVTWQQIGMQMADMQFLETRKFQRTEICGWFGVPPHKIGDLERATFSNIEEQNIQWAVDTIRPLAIRQETEYNRQLLGDEAGVFSEHAIDGLQRGNISTRYAAYATGRQWGWLSVNDIRKKENLNPLDNGDVYLQPMNMVEAGTPADATAPALTAARRLLLLPDGWASEGVGRAHPTGSELEERSEAQRRRIQGHFRRLLLDASKRVVNREVNDVRAATERYLARRDAGQLSDWLATYYRDQPATITRIWTPVISAFADAISVPAAEEIGQTGGMDAELEVSVAKYVEIGSNGYSQRSLNQLELLLRDSPPDLALPAIETRLDEWQQKKADKVADYEAVAAAAAFAIHTWRKGGIRKIVWRTHGKKDCPYCARTSSTRVKMLSPHPLDSTRARRDTDAPGNTIRRDSWT